MRTFFLLSTPYAYFRKTRLTAARDVLFSAVYEWLPGLAIVVASVGGELARGGLRFALGSVAFMSLYEIGYIANDLYAASREAAPRWRAEGLTPSRAVVVAAVLARLCVYLGVAVLLGKAADVRFHAFHACMLGIFAAHNVLPRPEWRVPTFLGLAFCRFWGPTIATVTPEWLAALTPGVLLFYVFYRSLTYMESKGLLRIPGRSTHEFKLGFYSLLLPLAAALDLTRGGYATLAMNAYLVGVWGVVTALSSVRRKRQP